MELAVNTNETIADIAERLKKDIDAVRVQWNRTIRKETGRTFDRTYTPTESEREVLKLTDKRTRNKRTQSTPKERTQPATAPIRNTIQRLPKLTASGSARALCLVIVVMHGLLIWYDCATLWNTPGFIGGAMAFVIQLAALLFSMDETRVNTSSFALSFVALLDVLAWFAHEPVFRMASNGANWYVTASLAGILCAASFVALYLFRDSKLD